MNKNIYLGFKGIFKNIPILNIFIGQEDVFSKKGLDILTSLTFPPH